MREVFDLLRLRLPAAEVEAALRRLLRDLFRAQEGRVLLRDRLELFAQGQPGLSRVLRTSQLSSTSPVPETLTAPKTCGWR